MKKTEFTYQLSTNQPALRSFAFNFTKDQEDANDLVQDTILKAINYAEKFKEGTNFRGWLYTIMKNTFINNYRRTTKTQSLMSVSDEISSSQLRHSATKNACEGRFVLEDIHKALNKLEPEYQIPFIKYFEGFKYHEIAEILHIPIGTVKTRIHVARQLLKSNLKMYKKEFSVHSVNKNKTRSERGAC